MKTAHLAACCLLALALGAVNASANAAVAVAVGDNNYTFTLTEADTVDAARREAVEGCAKDADNCRALVATSGPAAVAIAKGDNGVFVATSPKPDLARQHALAGCKKSYANCRFTAIYWEPGVNWYARGFAKNEDGALVADYFSYNNTDRASAEQDALKMCRDGMRDKGNADQCATVAGTARATYFVGKAVSADGKKVAPFTYFGLGARADINRQALAALKKTYPGMVYKFEDTGENAGPQPEPKNFRAVAAQVEKVPRVRQPARIVTNSVDSTTCTNQCVNGSCLRTFPNGRTERWQAPRVFDPLSNDWKWDTNSCGR